MSKKYKVAILKGDGIGVEVTNVAIEVLKTIKKKFHFELNFTNFPQSGTHYLKTGEILSDNTLKELKKYDTILLGAVGHPDVQSGIIEKGMLLKLRFELDQYINLRPVKLYPNIKTPLKDNDPTHFNYIVVRENTGGLYTGAGGTTMENTPYEVATQEMIYTRQQVERCLRYAFKLADTRPAKKLALIGKTNVLTHIFGLWNKVFNELGEKEFPQIKREYYHIDTCCMMMIKKPETFDVLVTTNMFGDIITDLGAETQGGMGMAASGNINPECLTPSMFEPVHGSAPDIAGQNIANPLAGVMSSAMMLDFLGEKGAAQAIETAIEKYTTNYPLDLSTSDCCYKLLELLK